MACDEEWDGERVRRWLAQAEGLDRQLAPVSELLFAGADLQPGERVLDVGCGTGPTTRQAASAVGAGGWVAGLDVSGEMTTAAAGAPHPEGAAPLTWITADAVTWSPDIEPVDVVISRFGVMFFSDPSAAFANLAAASRPGGRLCAMAWDRRDRSEVFQVPLATTARVLAERGVEVADLPVGEGAFSLHDAAVVSAILGSAGWREVRVEPHAVRLRLGGGLPPAQAAEAAIGIGPSRVLTTGVDDDTRQAVVEALVPVLGQHIDERGDVVLGGSVLRLTAQRG